jgi:hypothetical protein
VAVTTLLAEIRELGYTGSANLLVRYLDQGRASTERAVPAPRRLVSWIMTRPADLSEQDREHLDQLLASCPHLAVLTEYVRAFAQLLTDRRGADLEHWMRSVEASDLPALHPFVRGLRKDLPAVTAGLSLCPTATARPRASTPSSSCSNDRCMDAQASPYSAEGSC